MQFQLQVPKGYRIYKIETKASNLEPVGLICVKRG